MRLEGQQIGRYRFEQLIGRGAMGEVYLAVDPRIQQQVAVKVLQAEPSVYPATNVAREAERFRREASAIANLRHPHIVPLYDYDETSIDETAITYLVIPYYKEGSFASWLQRRGSDLLPMEDVVYFVQQAADALQYAHNHQVIHRDVKPSNFLIETGENPNRPNLLLADFGISKFAMATTASGTQSLGTLTYMPPEQFHGRPTYASDQYALAIMAYELLVGHPPFEGPPPVVIRQHMEDQPQPPSMLNPGLPRDIDNVLLRALDKKPENRYPTISEFARALQKALPGASDIPQIQPESSSGELQMSAEVREAQKGSDIHVTLHISPAEAQSGTDHLVNLPGGQQVRVTVPANAYNGQVIDFPGLGESSPSGGLAGNLILTLSIEQQEQTPLTTPPQPQPSFTDEQDERSAITGENGHEQRGEEPWLPHGTQLPPSVSPPPSSRRHPGRKQLALIAVVVSLMVVASALLLPILLAQPAKLTTTSHPVTAATIVGHVRFTSSGQLNPTSSEGHNDLVHLDLSGLTPPAPGKSDYAWLLPDVSQNEQPPVLLGTLQILRGSAQLTYTSPNHTNLLATYSRFLVTEQAANEEPIIPSLDPATWRYAGSIPDTPTPGDANHYSLLSHLRHLLAKDPTLERIGLSGGLDIWLYRNVGKILEWSSAARDDWAGGQAALDLMRRQIDRVLDYLDGAAFVWRDVPPYTPLLVDPKAGRIGLLELEQGQNPPPYLAHVDLHLVGFTRSPGVTADQKQLATKIDAMLIAMTSLLWKVHADATLLAKMSDTALLGQEALSLLNDMYTNATDAFVGQPDPATGSVQGGVTQIHDQLQLLATIQVSRVTGG